MRCLVFRIIVAMNLNLVFFGMIHNSVNSDITTEVHEIIDRRIMTISHSWHHNIFLVVVSMRHFLGWTTFLLPTCLLIMSRVDLDTLMKCCVGYEEKKVGAIKKNSFSHVIRLNWFAWDHYLIFMLRNLLSS